MDRLNSVLVGVDFSEPSGRAVEHGLRVAEWNRASTRIFHAVSPTRHAVMGSDAGNQLEDFLEGLNVDPAVPRDVVIGEPLEQTLDLVRRHHTDLLVIGAFGPLGQFTGNGVGTFASQLLRHVPCTVLVVHPGIGSRFRRILAAVDFSTTSARALETSVRLCRQEGGQLHVLHVPDETEDEDAVRDMLRAELDAAGGSDLDHVIVVTRSGHPGREIIRYAREIEAHLIASGSRGKTALEYVLVGNTCETVLRAVRRSVLVTKPVDFVPPAGR